MNFGGPCHLSCFYITWRRRARNDFIWRWSLRADDLYSFLPLNNTHSLNHNRLIDFALFHPPPSASYLFTPLFISDVTKNKYVLGVTLIAQRRANFLFLLTVSENPYAEYKAFWLTEAQPRKAPCSHFSCVYKCIQKMTRRHRVIAMNNTLMSKGKVPLDVISPQTPLKPLSFRVVCDPTVSTVLIRLTSLDRFY